MRFIRKPVSSPGDSDDDKDGRRSAKLSAWNVDDGWGHPTFSIGLSLQKGIISINLSEVLEKVITDSDYSQSQMLEQFFDAFFRIGIMFPLTDDSGRVIAFFWWLWKITEMAVIKPEKKNSHSTVYLIRVMNFIIWIKPRERQKQHEMYIMEGFMDVGAAYRAGIENAVASMGTALTPGACPAPSFY